MVPQKEALAESDEEPVKILATAAVFLNVNVAPGTVEACGIVVVVAADPSKVYTPPWEMVASADTEITSYRGA